MKQDANFIVLDSNYGKFIINRHCAYQSEYLIKTGKPHIQPELDQLLSIVATLPDFSVTVDAGANAGLVGMPIAQTVKAKGGIVHCFEPQRMLFNALCGTVALNDLDNMFVYHKAVGDTAGKVKIPLPDYGVAQDFGQLTLVGDFGDVSYEMVDVATIDDMKLLRLDFLKIDVEGMEIEVLKGAANTIKKHLPWCWIEYWKIGMDTIREQFKDLPYQFQQVDKLNMLCAPTERLAQSGLVLSNILTK